MTDFAWTDTATEQMVALWEQGLSAAQVAFEVGTTRNAVIGKVYRLGLCRTRQIAPRHKGHIRKSRVAPSSPRILVVAPPVLAPVEDVAEQPVHFPPSDIKLSPTVVTLLRLTRSSCRWLSPEGKDIGAFTCTATAVATRPYCAEHCRIAYRQPPSQASRGRPASRRQEEESTMARAPP